MATVPAGPVFDVAVGAATDPGRVRRHNEDSYLAERPIFLVADGMGGHLRGEVASAEAVRQFGVLAGRPWVAAEDLHERLVAAASGVEALAGSGPAPGTTLAGVALTHESGRPYWLAFNLGDSRVYLLRQGLLEQISVDHSRHQELLEAGADPGSLNVGRHIITRALGAGGPAMPEWDLWLRPAQRGDRILICSDGLSTELTDLLIAATLRSAPEPQQAAQALVAAALRAAGRDNVTAVVVDALRVSWGGEPGDITDDTETEREPSALDEDTVDLADLGRPAAGRG